MCGCNFISLGVISRSETARPYGMNVFNSVRNCQASFRAAPFASLTVSYSHPESWPSLGGFRLDLKKCRRLERAFPSWPEVGVLCLLVTSVSQEALGYESGVGHMSLRMSGRTSEPACKSLSIYQLGTGTECKSSGLVAPTHIYLNCLANFQQISLNLAFETEPSSTHYRRVRPDASPCSDSSELHTVPPFLALL